jgi:hypothetical protein
MNNILLDFENRNFNELLNSLSFKNKTGEVADKIIETRSLVDGKKMERGSTRMLRNADDR